MRSPVPAPPRWSPPSIAHRGYSAVTPENTLAAVAAGIHAGAAWIEVDVRTTADGVPVVVHDRTVDRTTDGTGAVAALTAAEVRRLDAGSWFSPAFAGQRIPTLDEVLALVTAGSARLLLEVKRPAPRAHVAAILAAVDAHGLTDRVLLQSYDEQVLLDAGDLAPPVPRGLLRDTVDPDPVAAVRRLGATAYNVAALALLDHPGTVGRLRSAGIMVMPHTVDDPAVWTLLAELGVDAVITNRPGELEGWRRALRDPVPAA
jgi:glycerophosphoryl diester phosphodiesterase